MTLIDQRVLDSWFVTPASSHDHPAIADFLATTADIGGRKFAADSRDVAEQLSGALPGAVVLLRDEPGRVRGYAALSVPHGLEPELLADFVFDPAAPASVVDEIVGATVDRFGRESAAIPGAYLRAFVDDGARATIAALTRRGAGREGQFVRTRKSLQDEDRRQLESAAVEGLTILRWPEVVTRGLLEQVRRLQFDTFLEHFGNMSKTPEVWQHHIESRLFTPDFSIAAVDEDQEVVGYVLGSTYTAGSAGADERSAHTDYIGVRSDLRRHGIGELLLKKIWLAALQRGVTVASLGTDIHNRSNAHLLYARLGYVAVEHQSAYRIDSVAR
jgi:ribosomal protein S18 acetylase RimI-like enzyme